MIQICRAEDGHVFKVHATLRDIERIGSLELFIHQEAGIDQEAVLAYLSDGRRLTNGNIRELAGSHDQVIYVFNKHYLDYDSEDVLRELHVEPPLQPPIEESIATTPPFRPSELANSYLQTAHIHTDHINTLLFTLHCQHEAIRVASNSLDLHLLTIVDAFESVALGARKELEKQATLLAGVEADLEIISRVKIHTDFLSPAARKAIHGGEKPRTLGDYVSNAKMKQVADSCARTHEDLRTKFIHTEQGVSHLTEGATAVRALVSTVQMLENAESSARRSQTTLDQIAEAASKIEASMPNTDTVLQNLKQLDATLRNEVRFMADSKNAFTEHCLGVLQRIGVLNNDLIQLPPALSNLQASFRGKTSFSHIQRLHNMVYAYGATVIEIVRRKEFSRFFNQRAQSILEVMAKLSASEKKRRQVYRGDVHGQLPFEAKGMDDPVPTLDFTSALSSDVTYSLEREDVDGLLRVLDDLEQFSRTSNDAIALGAVKECRLGLEKLINKMDSLETAFDRIAERSLLSASRLSSSRRRSLEADDQAFQELQLQLQATQDSKIQQEQVFQEERGALEAEIARLRGDSDGLQDAAAEERARADRLERELHQARAQAEGESTARRILDDRHAGLTSQFKDLHQDLMKALADVTDKAKEAEAARQELAQIRIEFEDVKALESKNSAKIASLLEEQANNLLKLEEARSRGEDLESQIQAARSESDQVHHALKEAGLEKDRLLRVQATEHDRVIRDHIAEADGDRAVLDQRFHELKAVLEDTERQLKDARAELDVTNADGIGLREELQRLEHELREAHHVERILRDDLSAGRASQSGFEQRLQNSDQLIAQILDVALAFRVSHVKAMNTAQTVTAHPGSRQPASLAESAFGAAMRHSIVGPPDEPSPIDPSDPQAALEALRAFDHDHFLEVIAKTGSTIRKWQKQCKEYRERAKGKISFRNFAKGDLALFLPTRNSVSKPWAAFNVSFPHYFLQASGHLAEQLRTREWIVARITSITERLVDRNDPSSNPFALGDGVKYYMLEVEDWTQPSQPSKRKSSSSKPVSSDRDREPTEDVPLTAGTSPTDIPPGPPQSEVEDTFRVTRPPTSHLFPSRSRANSSPLAGPSSLSRLLAQAPSEATPSSHLDPIPPSRSTSPSLLPEANASSLHSGHQPATSPHATSPPPASSPPPPSPSQTTGHHVPTLPSPLRPGSRASRLSSASRFSVGRVPPIGLGHPPGTPVSTVKAAATTALSELPLSTSPSSGEGNPFGRPATPSPDGSATDGMSNVLNRRRTTSYHIPSSSTSHPAISSAMGAPIRPSLTATGTLASLATSWGVSFGRKKKTDTASPLSNPTPESGSPGSTPHTDVDGSTSAKDMLKRF